MANEYTRCFKKNDPISKNHNFSDFNPFLSNKVSLERGNFRVSWSCRQVALSSPAISVFVKMATARQKSYWVLCFAKGESVTTVQRDFRREYPGVERPVPKSIRPAKFVTPCDYCFRFNELGTCAAEGCSILADFKCAYCDNFYCYRHCIIDNLHINCQ